MKHYLNTADNTIWAYDDDVNPSDFNGLETLQVIEEERPSNIHQFENNQWVLPVIEEVPVVELTPAEKLAQAGLSVDELKQLLGL